MSHIHSDELKCSFCGASSKEVLKLVKGIEHSTFICDICILDAYDIIEDWKTEQKTKKKASLDRPTPKEMVRHLDQYVIGQTQAKRIIAVAVYNHYKRIGVKTNTELGKANVLLIGPTGSGKTLLAETIARLLEVPFAAADATSMTEAGYVGDDVESVLVRLLQNADGNIEKAEKGIVYIDEIDKIAVKDSRGRDVSGEGVQQGLLRMLEGAIVTINPNGKKSAQGPQEMINTKDILFIVGGAFSGLTDFDNNRPRQLGIMPDELRESVKRKKIRAKDLVKYGMIPEFIGRFALIAELAPLKEEDLVRILSEPKNSLSKQYQELLAIDGVSVKFTDDFLKAVAQRAANEGTGARGLRSILEPIMTEIMYTVPDAPTAEITVTKDFIEKADA